MGRNRATGENENKAGVFFLATLVLWFVSVWFEILFNKRSELLWVVSGCFFFQTANWVIRYSLSRDPLFVNTSVSLLHSTVTSVSVCSILANQWLIKGSSCMFEHSQLFGGTWPWAYPALCFSCGYFAYDQWDMLHYGLYNGWFPSILVHHLVLLICFTLALFRNVTINYLILTLICELHSIFLHVRKIRRMAGVRDAKSIIVKLEWLLNWITFTFARFASHILITAKLIHDASKFGKGMELPLALFGMVGMNLLNVCLGIDLVNAFKREMNYQQLHSIFLHVRKIRRMAGVRDAKSIIVKLEWLLNWITFTFARFASHILITAKLIHDASKFGKGMELPLALFGMVGMNLLNVCLGIDLVNAFKREMNYQQLHSIFLHVRKIRRMAGVRDAKSIIVKLEWLLNWITFTFARFASHILITAKLIHDASKFGKGMELPLALFGMVGMNLLNVCLGIDLVNAFKREMNYQQVNLHPD